MGNVGWLCEVAYLGYDVIYLHYFYLYIFMAFFNNSSLTTMFLFSLKVQQKKKQSNTKSIKDHVELKAYYDRLLFK